MAALDSFMRGYNFVDRHMDEKRDHEIRTADRERNYRRQDEADKRASESHESNLKSSELNRSALSQNLEAGKYNLEKSKYEDKVRKVRSMAPWEMARAKESGFYSAEFLTMMDDAHLINLEHVASGQHHKDLNLVLGALENPAQANETQLLQAANRLFSAQVSKGVGEKDSSTGKVIEKKEIAESILTDDGKGVMLNLKITYDDGSVDYKPVTEKRLSNPQADPNIKVLKFDDVFRNIKGQKIFSQELMSPANREPLKAALNSITRGGSKLADQIALEDHKSNLKLNANTVSDMNRVISDLVMDGVPQDVAGAKARVAYGKGTEEDRATLLEYQKQEYYTRAGKEYAPFFGFNGPKAFAKEDAESRKEEVIDLYKKDHGGMEPEWSKTDSRREKKAKDNDFNEDDFLEEFGI